MATMTGRTGGRRTVGGAVLALLGCMASCGGDGPGGGPPGVEPNVAPPESPPDRQASVVIFDEARIHEVRLYMSDDDFTSILEDTRGDELRPATFSLDGVVIANVGVRPAGESSRVPGNQKMSMRVEFAGFDKGKRFGGVDEVKLSGSWDDPFIIRDRLAYWVYRQVMPAPREVPAQLWVNGQPRGIFEIEEIWGKEALAERFPDPTGALYRLRGLTNEDPYAYRGADTAAYVPLPWDPKGTIDPGEYAAIPNALQVIAADTTRLGDVLDVDTLLTYFAVSAIVANTDGFTGPFEVDDHFQYRDPATGRFVILPWDPDNTFGSINDLPSSDMFVNYERCVVTRLVRDTDLRDRYFAKLDEVMQKVPGGAIQQQADAMAGQIRQAAHDDQTKMYPTESFEWSIGYIKDWIAARYGSLASQMAVLRQTPPGSTPAGGTP